MATVWLWPFACVNLCFRKLAQLTLDNFSDATARAVAAGLDLTNLGDEIPVGACELTWW